MDTTAAHERPARGGSRRCVYRIGSRQDDGQRDGPAGAAGPVVLRESSVVLGSLASGALSPTEARRIGRIGGTDPEPAYYPFPSPTVCRGAAGNASRETDVS
jgi:hypothetical protein